MNLFEPLVPEDRLHRYFKDLITDPALKPVQRVLQSWGNGLLDRQGEQRKFVTEFQTTFNSALWELYLNQAFSELGFSVDYTNASPDFNVRTPAGYEFNVEAVIADRTDDNDVIPSRLDEADIALENSLKLAGKMRDKLNLFTGSKGAKTPYATLDHVQGRPFVIAIAPFNSAAALMQNNVIINRVLFGIEEPDAETMVTGVQGRLTHVEKPSGAKVEMGIFTNDSYKEISAVIFSTTGTLGKARVESGFQGVVKSTRYRNLKLEDFLRSEGMGALGISTKGQGTDNEVMSVRVRDGNVVWGSDMRICHPRFHQETHLDGLQIYYNPYATVPFDPDILDVDGIAHNYWDAENDEPVQDHPDNSLVSRQLWLP
jgi:hypothetical protein